MVDWSIATQIQPPQIMNPGQMAQSAMLMRQQQNQNALRAIMSQPGAIGDDGMPTQNAMKQLYSVDPGIASGLQQNALKTQGMKSELWQQQHDAVYRELTPAVEQYETDLRNGIPQEVAQRNAQKVYTDALGSLAKGPFSQEQLKNMPPDFNYGRIMGGMVSYEQRTKMAQEARRTTDYEQNLAREARQGDERLAIERERLKAGSGAAGWQILTDPANNQQYRYNVHTGEATTMDMQPYHPGGAQKLGGKGGGTAQDKEADAKTIAATNFKRIHGRDPTPEDEPEMATLRAQARQSSGGMAGRNIIMMQRALTSAADAVADLKNVVELPITLDTGVFGGRRQGPGLMSATKEVLANEVTAEDAQAYNTQLAGLERALGGLATGGLAVDQNTMNQFAQLQIKKGDTNLIKLRKLGTMRQNVENALEAMAANPQLGDAQRAMVDKLNKELVTAIPWTPHDVNEVEFAKDKNVTVADFAKKSKVSQEKTEETKSALPANLAKIPGLQRNKAGTKYRDPATGKMYDQDGKELKGG